MKRHIVWPAAKADAARLYLRYVIRVLDEVKISFGQGPNDPFEIARHYVEGRILLQDMQLAADEWRTLFYRFNGFQNPGDKDVLEIRLALALLSLDGVDDFNEALSWFDILLEKFGVDPRSIRRLMDDYFNFSST